MAEINRSDIIDDGALKAPLDLADNLKVAVKSVDDLLNLFRTLGREIKLATSLGGLKEETTKLKTAQTELDKVNKQINSTIQKNTKEYIEQQKVLAKLKQEIKDKIALDGRDAKEVNKLNASVKMLSAALDVNRRAYSAMTTEQERASAAGLQLERIINQQSNELDELRVKQGQYNQRVGQYEQGILAAYNKVNQLNTANKELLVLQGKLTLNTAEERAQYEKLGVAIQNNITQINQYNSVISKAGGTLKGFATQTLAALGLVSAIYSVIAAIKSFISINKEFEKSLSDLKALTGASTEDLVFYSKAAIDIGGDTKRSASDIVQAFKLIGGARPELLKVKEDLVAVAKEAVILANASGLELPEAADALAGALNQLQLPASSAREVIDSLAKAAQGGAAEIPDLNLALQEFGALLKDQNGGIAEGAALIEVLADRQIKGAEAGIGLRNVLLSVAAVDVLPKKAQQQLQKFGVDLAIVRDAALPLNVRLRELAKISGDASALVKVFGKENFIAGNIVLNNVDKFEKLTAAINGTDKESSLTGAVEQASDRLNNLAGDQQEALAATEALTLEYGGSFQKALRKVVQLYTFLINVFREAPEFIKENSTAIKALGFALIALNIPLILSTANTLRVVAAEKLYTLWTKASALATRYFFATLINNPFGLMVASIGALIAAFAIYDKTTDHANKITKESIDLTRDLNNALENINKSREEVNTSLEDFIKLSPDSQKQLQREVDLRKQIALATLAEVIAKKEKLKADVRELSNFQKFQGSIKESLGIGSQESIADSLAGDIDAKFQPAIDRIKASIDGFKEFIFDSNKVVDEETEKQLDKEKDATFKLRKYELEQAIRTQEEIVENEGKANEVRFAAIREIERLKRSLAKVGLEEDLSKLKITKSEETLAYKKFQVALTDAAKEGIKDREKLVKEAADLDRKYTEAVIKGNIQLNQNIIDNDKSTFEQREAAIINNAEQRQLLLDIARADDLKAAKGNVSKLLTIEEDYANASKEIAHNLVKEKQNNFLNSFAKGFDTIEAQSKASKEALLKNLNEQFQQGEITVVQYNKQRVKIEKANQEELLNLELEFAKKILALRKAEGYDTTALEKAIADLEVIINQHKTDELVKMEEIKAQKIKELKQAAYDFVLTLNAAIATKEVNRLNDELANLKSNYDRQVELAGDNETRKAALKRKFERQEDQIQKRRAQVQRKAAIIEKSLNAARATISTARAVADVLPNIPLALIIGALGAIEVATILATPIPQFEKGGVTKTKNFVAGEKGSELMFLPNNKIDLTPDKPTLMNAPIGTRIVDSKRTIKMLAQAAMAPTDLQVNYEKRGSKEVVGAIKNLQNDFRQGQKKGGGEEWMKSAAALYHVKKENENFKTIVHDFSLLNAGK